MPLKKCEVCGSEFQARLSKVRTCSIQCRNQFISSEKSLRCQKTKACVVCAKEFAVGAVDAHKQTCSTACSYKLRGSKTSKSAPMQCLTCNKGFLSQLSQMKTPGGGRYCSKQCQYDRNLNATTRACVCCGKAFSSPPSQMHVKTCSTECGYEWFTGERNGRYFGATRKVIRPDGTVATVENRWYAAKKGAARRMMQQRATPVWVDMDAIRKIYDAAFLLEQSTGEKYHVDHIVPLKGKTVSGLHNQFNLQVLPWRDNLIKGNRHWPDMP